MSLAGCGYIPNPNVADSKGDMGDEVSDSSGAASDDSGSSGGPDSSGGSGSTDNESNGETDPNAAPEAPSSFELDFSQVKQFGFSWGQAAGARYYQLLESVGDQVAFAQVGGDIFELQISLTMTLFARANARYILRACNDFGCTDSDVLYVTEMLVDAIGYFKASNTDMSDAFGSGLAISKDGNTIAVGAFGESSGAVGINGDQTDNSLSVAGAVYIFAQDALGAWEQEAYIKASNTGNDNFGTSLALSENGDTLAIGAYGEDSAAVGVGGSQIDNLADNAGAVYVYVRDENGWMQQAYVKASNAAADHRFGCDVALSNDGNTMAVGALGERSSSTGINGSQVDNSPGFSGSVYVFDRDPESNWAQQAYVKASNTGSGDQFGYGVALSGDGNTLAVTAIYEDSNATGVNGDQSNDMADASGAAYVYTRNGIGNWSQEAYIKASNTASNDFFGASVALSASGTTLAIGAYRESSAAVGIDGNQTDNSAAEAGVVYVYMREEMTGWVNQAYIKASNSGSSDNFGRSVALSGDGTTLAVGAPFERSGSVGIDGDQTDDSLGGAGAVYVYRQDRMNIWTQQAYVKASNSDANDHYGWRVVLSGEGAVLGVGASSEASVATGISNDQSDNSALDAGAVYIY